MTNTTPRLGSILLASTVPDRLRAWYQTAFSIRPDHNGVLDFGGVGLLIDGRDDIADPNPQPGRVILNFETDDAHALTARLDGLGVRWIAKLEERDHGLFATLADPDGNYIQVLQLNAAYHGGGVLNGTRAYSGFAVDDLAAARQFYERTLGLTVTEEGDLLNVTVAGGAQVLIYPKPDHQPAAFTVLNFPVDDIDAAVEQLAERGVRFRRFDGIEVDEKGISRGDGPSIAWFTDPAGNVLSVLQEK